MEGTMRSGRCWLIGVGLAALGCTHAGTQRVTYGQAMPIQEETAAAPVPAPRAPTTVAYSAQTLDPHMSRPTPAVAPPAKKPAEVIDQANRSASQGPEAALFSHAIQEYAFAPGVLYQIYAAPMRITDIALEPGEDIVGTPACGDKLQWKLTRGDSLVDGRPQVHVRIKPTFGGLSTNMVLDTNKRSYLLELHSYETTYMAGVQWRYPDEELATLASQAKIKAEKRRNAESLPSLDKLHFGYRLVMEDPVAWRPIQVFDDGAKTYIVFPPAMQHREAPVLFVVRDGETQLVNFRVRRNHYIVDRLFDEAELRVGQSNPEIVRIVAPWR
jgi:P-type conjugative transfer protein TrbG